MYQMLDHEPEEYTPELAEALKRLENPFHFAWPPREPVDFAWPPK